MITISYWSHNSRSYSSRMKIQSKYPFKIVVSEDHSKRYKILCSFKEVKSIFNKLFDKYWDMIHKDGYLPPNIDITCRTKEQNY